MQPAGCIKQQETGLLHDYSWVAAEPPRMQKIWFKVDVGGSVNVCN